MGLCERKLEYLLSQLISVASKYSSKSLLSCMSTMQPHLFAMHLFSHTNDLVPNSAGFSHTFHIHCVIALYLHNLYIVWE